MITKDLIKMCIELQEKAFLRAEKLFDAKGSRYSSYSKALTFENDKVSVMLEENARYGQPEIDYVDLTEHELSLSDSDFQKHVDAITKKNQEEKQMHLDGLKKQELENKRKQLKQLKKELGEI